MTFTRRSMLGSGAIMSLLAASETVSAEAVTPDSAARSLHGRSLRVLDLTHKLTRAFAFTPGRLSMESVQGSGVRVGMAMNRVCIVEHTGTHIDAPRHFAPEGASVGDIPVGELFVPLAVVDIREKVRLDRDAHLTAKDLERWEARHGRLPSGCCVAMLSGWKPLEEVARYTSLSPAERGKSPGFDMSAIELLTRRGTAGIGVDTLSLDPGGQIPDYPVHQAWLRAGHWGLEGLANLDRAPASGGLMFVGAAPLADATGMPARIIAIY